MDQMHLASRGRPDQCYSCHGPDGAAPRTPNHPLGKDCTRCHYWEGEAR